MASPTYVASITLLLAGVLDEGEDTLVNINMLEDEHAKRNIELRKGKPGYQPYDEGQQLDSVGTCPAGTGLCLNSAHLLDFLSGDDADHLAEI